MTGFQRARRVSTCRPRNGPMIRGIAVVAFTLAVALPPATRATEALRLYDGPDGATCEYFNMAARIPWRNKLGDWMDARGQPGGAVPWARVNVPDLDRRQSVAWDVSELLRAEDSREARTVAIVIRPVPPNAQGVTVFFSREAKESGVQPRLVVELADGGRQAVAPLADTFTDCSTVRSMGSGDTLKVSSNQNLLLEFDLREVRRASPIAKATLQLTATEKQYGDNDLGIYQLDAPGPVRPAAPTPGLAAAYPGDAGIARDRAVIMATGFESASWLKDWGDGSPGGSFSVIAEERALRFEPLSGRALLVTIPGGKNLGLNLHYRFRDRIGSEPEEIYFRYYLRFADDWAPATGGKLPGISGTYNRAGWGGRRSDGSNGWSMRGLFLPSPEQGNPLQNRITLGTYAYHADMDDFWGGNWAWMQGLRGLVEKNRWYSIEQYLRINTPGARDGVLRVWIDGTLAFERTDIRVRNVPTLKIESIWMNVYHGGRQPAPRTMHLYIDNVVIARKYIGPMQGKER